MALDTIPKQEGGKLKAVASGTLPNGKPVVVNSDGTVSVVVGATQTIGTPSQFASAGPRSTKAAYDTTAQKVVIVYQDFPDGRDGQAIVGTVSGSSISFGTAVEFASSYDERDGDVLFDPDTGKIIISYGGSSNYGTAIVGTVSGNSISFGTPVVFNSSATYYSRMSYDTVNNKVVIAYNNNSEGSAIVGTVSGTSISFGSEATFNGNTAHATPVYDVASGKTVVFYVDQASSFYGNCAVGTISGTSISFGTETTFNSASTDNVDAVYHPSVNKIVVAYEDNGNSDYPTAIVGTVSGTSISFGSSAVVTSEVITQMAVVYDPESERIVFSYKRESPNNQGSAKAATLSGTTFTFEDQFTYTSGEVGSFQIKPAIDTDSGQLIFHFRADDVTNDPGQAVAVKIGYTTLTSENYIGISTGGAVADTGNATVDIVGTVNKDQSGLTAGQAYYVQTDGTLGTTADDPSVFAGTAVSATKMVVKS